MKNCEASEASKKLPMISKLFSGNFGNKMLKKIYKKIVQTNWPLSGISSPVEQVFFFFLALYDLLLLYEHYRT